MKGAWNRQVENEIKKAYASLHTKMQQQPDDVNGKRNKLMYQ